MPTDPSESTNNKIVPKTIENTKNAYAKSIVRNGVLGLAFIPFIYVFEGSHPSIAKLFLLPFGFFFYLAWRDFMLNRDA